MSPRIHYFTGAILVLVLVLVLVFVVGCGGPTAVQTKPEATPPSTPASLVQTKGSSGAPTKLPGAPGGLIQPLNTEPLASYVENGINWLVKSQHTDGGWGAGSHAAQNIKDPHAVKTDPATTAFAAIALMRSGHTLSAGKHTANVRRAAEYLVNVVEKAPTTPGRITPLEGTQIQAKLGPLIDTPMTLQFFSRALESTTKQDPLYARINTAADKCIAKLQETQAKDGSWGKAAGWAPVLQSSMSCSALEYAQASGKKVDAVALENARTHQKGNWDAKTNTANAEASAGVELYAFSGSQRANSTDSRRAKEIVKKAVEEGKLLKDAPVNEDTLRKVVPAAQAKNLSDAFTQNEKQVQRMDDAALVAGFGNNGGEEYLSHLMTAESLVIDGNDKWRKWNATMSERLQKVQNPDGSWAGHHCISSPVFCTAAVVQCATVDRDPLLLKVVVASADAKK